jgi:hypothetical protein
MDREAAVIRQEMSQTRAELDRKLSMLEDRARDMKREMSPRNYWAKHKPDYLMDRVIGGVLTLVGLKMTLSLIRSRRNHRAHVRAAAVSYGRW